MFTKACITKLMNDFHESNGLFFSFLSAIFGTELSEAKKLLPIKFIVLFSPLHMEAKLVRWKKVFLHERGLAESGAEKSINF
jgi:hypothetical protein